MAVALLAADLIAAVAAIVVHVAAPALLDALAVGARELIGAARLVAVRLIAAVRTVLGVVANPCQRHAFAIVAAARKVLAGAALVVCTPEMGLR